MTVKDEIGNHDEYEKLRFTEYLEWLGRCAYAKFINDSESSMHEKLELMMKIVFQQFGLTIKKVKEEIDDDNTSEESVDVKDASSDEDLKYGTLDSDRMLY